VPATKRPGSTPPKAPRCCRPTSMRPPWREAPWKTSRGGSPIPRRGGDLDELAGSFKLVTARRHAGTSARRDRSWTEALLSASARDGGPAACTPSSGTTTNRSRRMPGRRAVASAEAVLRRAVACSPTRGRQGATGGLRPRLGMQAPAPVRQTLADGGGPASFSATADGDEAEALGPPRQVALGDDPEPRAVQLLRHDPGLQPRPLEAPHN
jgi:hypothetical protein